MKVRLGRSLLAALVVLAASFTARLDAAKMTIASVSATPGGTARVSVVYASEGTPFASLFFIFSFPASVSFVGAENGPIISGSGLSVTATGGPGSAYVFATPVSPSSESPAIADGLFATFTLAIAPGTSGTLPLQSVAGGTIGNILPDFHVGDFTVVPGAINVGCGTPGAPAFTTSAATLEAGRSYAASWSAASGLDSTGSYVLETSRTSDFAAVLARYTTSSTTVLVPTDVSGSDASLFLRVRALQGGCASEGPSSPLLQLTVRGLADTFAATSTSLALAGTVGGAAPSGSARFKNVGGRTGTLLLSVTGSSFDVSSTSLNVPAGQEAGVTVTARAAALRVPAILEESLVARFGEQTIRLPITLSVAPASGSSRAGTRIQASPISVVFSAPAGQAPPARTVRLTVQPKGTGPLFLSPAIGPGGAWLLPPAELASPVPASNELTLTLQVDRTRRSAVDGILPLRTLLTLTPVGGDAADAIVLDVTDIEPAPVVAGNDRGAPPSSPSSKQALLELLAIPTGSSFIVPSCVKASGRGGSVFTSDGWLKNQSSTGVSADFYFTPDGKNGLTDAGVRKTTQTIPAGATLRLSDLVGTFFATGDVSGQVEVRSAAPRALTLRTSVDAVTGGDPASRYGTEMPVVSYGSGVAKGGGELVLPGIDADESRRANMILAETTGAAAKARIAVFDANGALVGAIAPEVPPYGKIQINDLVLVVKPGATLTGGWAAVSVDEGAGRIAAIVTIIDNRSNSFSAIRGQAARAALPLVRGKQPLLAVASSLILPSAARLTGAANTRFTTRVAMVNGTAVPAVLAMTYHYVDVNDGGKQKTVQMPITIPPRGALANAVGNDIVATLFNLTSPTFGWMEMTGDVGRVIATTAVSAQVDPNDPSKGVKTAQVGGVLSDAPEVIALNAPERRFAGAEKSVQRRTNLALVETKGEAARVAVRLYATTGIKLAERSFDLTPGQYLQITDVFGPNGANLGDGPFQDVEITAQVTSGGGRVVAVASVNDNISRNPELFVLKDAGPPPPVIDF